MTDVNPAAGSERTRSTPRRKRRFWPLSEALAALWLGGLVVAMIVLPSLLALDPLELDSTSRFAMPGPGHLLGTDNLGRDLLARCLDGARISLLIGIGSTLIAALIGIPLGMIAAWSRGWVDAVISFVLDVILAFPGLVLALGLAAFLGPSVTNIMIAITVPMMPVFARLSRAQTLRVLSYDYVEASHMIGTPARSIMRRDVLPNISEALLAVGFVSVGTAILIEGGLSFLGIGVPMPQPTWGSMIDESRTYLATDPWLATVPALFLMFTILSLNLIADRFLLDPDAAKEAVR